jgi:hypothetical protein
MPTSRSIREALRPPSGGVVFWSWQALEDEPEKKAALKAALPGSRSHPSSEVK